ncbi:MAG: glycosyltransferase family 10, partial [Actinomycetota bacterium]|nr:glycosyltransferase family 10 [Actinomycetota bacterium]
PLIEGIAPDVQVERRDHGPVDLEFVSTVIPWPSLVERVGARARRELHARAHIGRLPSIPAQPSNDARVSVWFTGENFRPPPPSAGWDLTLSFDPDSELMGNLYFPQWWMLLPELLAPMRVERSPENRLGREVTIKELMAPRIGNASQRPGFACAIINNGEHQRLSAISALETIGPVDVFGSFSGRVVSTKDEVLRNYRFCICFENDVHPGYVTEKVFDAWAGGCIPIWNGWDSQGYVNESAVLNLAQHASIDKLVEAVGELNADSQEIDRMASQAILKKSPSLIRVRARLGEILRERELI